MKCLVTGAGGFIGSALSRELAARGHTLTLLIRNKPPLVAGVDGTEMLRLELGSEPIAADLLRGIATVYHCAGIAHQAAAEEDYQRVNHSATLELAAAAEAAGVTKFVFLSSVKAAEPATPYGRWKWRTEQALAAACVDSPMAVTSVRPALVYGPAVRGNLRTLIAAVKHHLPLPPEGGSRSLVGLSDLVAVLGLLGESRMSGYSCFEVTDGEEYSSRRLYSAIRFAMGKSAGRAWLPRAGWFVGCALLDVLRPDGGEGSYQKLFGEELYSNADICAALNWQPQYTVEQQIGDMLGEND